MDDQDVYLKYQKGEGQVYWAKSGTDSWYLVPHKGGQMPIGTKIFAKNDGND